MVPMATALYRGRTMTHMTPYGSVPPAWPMPRNHGMAMAALVCGIVGLIAVPGVGVVAWVLGHMALKEIDSSPEAGWSNRDHASIGKILGIVGTVLYGAIFLGIILLYVGLLAFAFAAAPGGG